MLGVRSLEELNRIVRESMGRLPFPQVRDEQVRQRGLQLAAAQGLPGSVMKELSASREVPPLTYSGFREFSRTGNRTHYEAHVFRRGSLIKQLSLAAYLGAEGVTDYLCDLLWAECEATWWELPAHERPDGPIDLWVAMNAFGYAFIVQALAGVLPQEVVSRVKAQVIRRALDEFLKPGRKFWWKRCTNNWNAVCNGGCGLAAMILENQPERLSRILGEVLENLECFLDGFTSDGGCTEGPSYWRFGFHWYAMFAAGLYNFTAGAVNIMSGPRIQAICRYPLALAIGPCQEVMFADVHPGYMPASLAILVNQFQAVPELFGLCRLNADGSLAVDELLDLLLYDGQPHQPLRDQRDYHLPELGVVKVRGGQATLAAKAGHNAEHHNHNDVGNFVLHVGGTFFIADLGAPTYSRDTFSARRYASIFCNSRGHNVPVVNGRLQQDGRQHEGSLSVTGLNGGAERRIVIELAKAYDEPALKRLTRRIDVPADGRSVRLVDEFVLARPLAVEEAFITTLPAETSADGAAVVIGSAQHGAVEIRSTGTAGSFSVTELTEAQSEARHGETIRRISFVPNQPQTELRLEFLIQVFIA